MKKNNSGNNNGKARVRVFFGEIEGDNETVMEALRSIGSAVGKTFQPDQTTVRVLTVSADSDHKQLTATVEQAIDEAEILEEANEEQGTSEIK